MNPVLVALFGPLKGSIFRWDEEEITIGRDSSNSLSINDALVSRTHCKITKISNQFLIQDLDSRNGIFVDDIPVRKGNLQHGNQLAIGDSLFLFLLQDENNSEKREAHASPLTTELQLQIEILHSLIGESPAMKKVYEIIERVASVDSNVLIVGESGTGKELVARALHHNSARKNHPFIAINCAVLSETLFESELFGHEKGAFTGAILQKAGKLEMADQGTVFLDEISEIPVGIQAKLLRVIQEREFQRVGGTRSIQTNVRWIAATNSDLGEALRNGTFRDDLYYRLNVVKIDMPPLRERREDIPLLASYFLVRHAKRLGKRRKGITPDAREVLLQYDWPGNVRELENAIERAIVLGASDFVERDDLPEDLLEGEHPGEAKTDYHSTMRDKKKEMVLNALERSNGNYAEASKLLGVHITYLRRLMRNLNLKQN
jgi:Nif-specific regulatory protein